MRIALLTLLIAAGCATTAGDRIVGEWELIAGHEDVELDWFDASPDERARMRAEWSVAQGQGHMSFDPSGGFRATFPDEESEATYHVFLSEEDTAIVRFDPGFGNEEYYVFEVTDGLLFWNRQYVLRRVK